MWFRKIIILLIVSILICDFATAQQTPVKKDSTILYKNIETFSKRGKFTKFMYGLFFKPVASKASNKKAKKRVYKKLIQKPYSTFEGKTIRYINIETLDPFGYSIGDTIIASQNFLSKTGNKLHIKSQPIAIRNLLLIRQNQPFDSLLAKESERLVRSMQYIRDVSFFVKATAKNSDSVDVSIRVLDIWSMIPNGSASASSFTIDLTEKNFLGMGHEFQNIYTRNYDEKTNYLNINYTIPNIRNTYIRTTLHYDVLGGKNFTRSINIDRPFFSPFAKWAAGANFTQQYHNDSIRIPSLLFIPQKFKFNAQDFWAGNAFQLFKGNTEDHRTTNFISTVRLLRIRYLEKPTALNDPLNMFSNENFYLASFGLSVRKYVQDKYIFKFGITEDVPIGKVFSVTAGLQKRSNINRLYLGGRVSLGNYYTWGYLGSSIEYGTFFRASHPEQGVLTASVNYFTGLFEIGKWKFRQFVKPQITIGLNRFSYDSLTINNGFGLNGFNSIGLSGTRRLLFTLQTQAYAPWNFIGFRFGPFFTYSFGMLGNSTSGFKNSKIFSQIGLGILIKNENLVLNAFQISIAFYPSIPGLGQNVFKTNSLKTTDFGFRDFEIGKPGIVVYQ
jgi:hypothetical protein